MSDMYKLIEMLDGRDEVVESNLGVVWGAYSDPHVVNESIDGRLIVCGMTAQECMDAINGDDLRAENTRLRNVVAAFIHCLNGRGGVCRSCPLGHADDDECGAYVVARELGFEV